MTFDPEFLSLVLALFVAIGTAYTLAGFAFAAPSADGGRVRALPNVVVRPATAKVAPRTTLPPRLLVKRPAQAPLQTQVDIADVAEASDLDDGVEHQPSERFSVARQIVRLNAIVAEGANRAEAASRHHHAAALQLDLTAYAIQNLVDVIPSLKPAAHGMPRRDRRTVPVRAMVPAYALAA
jgi:hypothetical protein